MTEWYEIARWAECVDLARPGHVFEIVNGDGQALLTPCTPTLPELPFDWTAPPLRFRLVAELPGLHSEPLPAPAQ